MTRTRSARLAGFMFLFYIATALPSMVLFGSATSGATTSEKLANVAQHQGKMRAAAVLQLITIADAILLGVALFAITRDVDRDLAVMALAFRVVEGGINAIPTIGTLALLSAPDAAIAALLLKLPVWTNSAGAFAFSIGSTIFAWLFIRGRSIPAWLAWLGFIGSVILVIGLPLEMARLLAPPLNQVMWIPIALFEVILGFWLLIKGVAPSANQE